MAYIGRQLTSGNYLKLDDISSQFNGTTTTFNLTSGGTAFYPGSAYSLLVSLGGVIQEPVTSYNINQNQIIFTAAPEATDDFFCIVMGVSLGVGVPGEGTVSGSKLSNPFNYDSGLLYLDGTNDRVGIGTTNPTHKLHVVGDARITGILTVGTGSITINGSTDTISGVTTINTASINNGPLAGMRNKIINGAMEISQRGTSFAAASGYTLDRFAFGTGGATGGGVATITQSTDVPNNTFQNSLRVDVTTADTSIAAGDYSHVIQRIEGYNVRDLIGQTFTLSFWVKSPKTGTHCVSFRNSGVDRSYILEYAVSVANTWEYKSLTVTGGLITAGTWDWTNGRGLDVVFTLLTGSNYQTTAGAWQTGNFLGTSNQVNCMDSVANDFFLTGVQLEIGSTATPFERRPYGAEFALCQRYFQIIGAAGDASNGVPYVRTTSSVNAYQAAIPIPVSLRTNSPNFTRTVVSPSNIIHKPYIRWDTISSISFGITRNNYIHSEITPTNTDAGADGLFLAGETVVVSAEL